MIMIMIYKEIAFFTLYVKIGLPDLNYSQPSCLRFDII